MRKTRLNPLLLTAMLIPPAIFAALWVLAVISRSGQAPGLDAGRLTVCSDKPNCVCSEFPEKTGHFVEPIDISPASPDRAWQILKRTIEECGGKIVTEKRPYLAATFSSSVFGFVDDVECRLDEPGQTIHLRSASRVGYSDMGANRKRVQTVREAFAAAIEEAQ